PGYARRARLPHNRLAIDLGGSFDTDLAAPGGRIRGCTQDQRCLAEIAAHDLGWTGYARRQPFDGQCNRAHKAVLPPDGDGVMLVSSLSQAAAVRPATVWRQHDQPEIGPLWRNPDSIIVPRTGAHICVPAGHQ